MLFRASVAVVCCVVVSVLSLLGRAVLFVFSSLLGRCFFCSFSVVVFRRFPGCVLCSVSCPFCLCYLVFYLVPIVLCRDARLEIRGS